MAEDDERWEHRWAADRCVCCDLRRREEWVLDEHGQAVMVLVWFDETGSILRARPFPVLLGLAPLAEPTETFDAAFPGVGVGREPGCQAGRRTRR